MRIIDEVDINPFAFGVTAFLRVPRRNPKDCPRGSGPESVESKIGRVSRTGRSSARSPASRHRGPTPSSSATPARIGSIAARLVIRIDKARSHRQMLTCPR